MGQQQNSTEGSVPDQQKLISDQYKSHVKKYKMIVYNANRFIRKKAVKGGGLVNKLINSLPVELHLPGYQFCGPGTKLRKRIQRGDQGVNPLDAACRKHDIAYSQNKDIEQRHIADRELTERAWERLKSKDSSIGEKINAYLVTNIMKAKTKLGMGVGNKKPKQILGQQIFKNAIKNATDSLKSVKPTDINAAIKIARKEIQKTFRGKKSKVVIPRVIRVPKRGGFLPLIPILTGLGALGALASGSSAITNAVLNAKKAKEELQEQTRHNKTIEAMGKGLYLKPYKKGYGIYVDENETPKN
ncbi:uncharacterized protein [Musca autumnalis]|uniref:uncharacterized protein n=1 Tax=Musca autumnalis TaxID=221902 RepID=UPI003CEA6031